MRNARTSDIATSHEAALTALESAPIIEQRIYEIFKDFPDGLTDDELTDAYELSASLSDWELVDHDTPRKRRSDLKNAGLVEAYPGQRRNKKQVWRAI